MSELKRFIVCGGRDCPDRRFMQSKLSMLLKSDWNFVLVHGDARRKAKSLYQTTIYWRKYIMSNLNQDRGFFVDDATRFTLGSYTCDPEDISYHIPNDLDDRLDIIFDDFCYDCDTDGIHVSGRLRIEFLDDLPAFSTQLHSQVDRLIKHLQEN